MRPSRSTTAVCATLRTRARLWVMKIIARLRSACRRRSSSMITACTETSRADVTSSHTSRSGSTTRARALATRELVGVAGGEARVERHVRQNLPDSRRALLERQLGEVPELLGDDLPDGLPRVQRGVGVLEDVLDPP